MKQSSDTSNEKQLISNAFNDYFLSMFTVDHAIDPEYDVPRRTIPKFTISEEGFLAAICNLIISKSCGPDNIPNLFLLRYAEWSAKFLHLIYFYGLSTGTVPDE